MLKRCGEDLELPEAKRFQNRYLRLIKIDTKVVRFITRAPHAYVNSIHSILDSVPAQTRQLRENCFERDGHQRVVIDKFTDLQLLNAVQYIDNDENSLSSRKDDFITLQVAHIVPHALRGECRSRCSMCSTYMPHK